MTKKKNGPVIARSLVLIARLEVISGQSISYWQLTIISIPFILYSFHYRFSNAVAMAQAISWLDVDLGVGFRPQACR